MKFGSKFEGTIWTLIEIGTQLIAILGIWKFDQYMSCFPSLLQLSDTPDLSSLVVGYGKHLSLLLSSGSLKGGGRFTALIVMWKVRERKELSMQSKLWLRKGTRYVALPVLYLYWCLWPVASVVTRATWIVCVCFLLQSQIMSGKEQGPGSQAGVVGINHAFHLYYKCCMWIEFQSISTWPRGFPPGSPVSSLLKIDS